MIFSKFYSVYFAVVAEILQVLSKREASERELQKIVEERAFSESVLTIIPSLKSEKWQLIDKNLSSILHNPPTIPLTVLEKRWLKAIMEDARIKLFNIKLPDLENIEPLFTRSDYKIFDSYADGDPFEDDGYISRFHLIHRAIKSKSPVKITMISRHGKEVRVRFYPIGFEYSVKDDKIRVVATGCKFSHFNLARIVSCHYYHGNEAWEHTPRENKLCEITLEIKDQRNALERAMLHFAHFEKQAERMEDNIYILRLKYHAFDETELVIRILSFGPFIKVLEPESFVNLIKERLIMQKSCGLK